MKITLIIEPTTNAFKLHGKSRYNEKFERDIEVARILEEASRLVALGDLRPDEQDIILKDIDGNPVGSISFSSVSEEN